MLMRKTSCIQGMVLPFLLTVLLYSCANFLPGRGEEEMSSIALYSVHNGQLSPVNEKNELYYPSDDADKELHEIIWQNALNIIPDSYEHYIHFFRISTDGMDNVMAYVEPKETDQLVDLASWTLTVDPLDVMDRFGAVKTKDMNETLIHEFAHILSLDQTQVKALSQQEMDDERWIQDWDFNKVYRTFDSIAYEDSYLNLFFQRFWGERLYREWLELEDMNLSDSDFEDAHEELSIKYYMDFVSDYATTNPEEDFAESFLLFVVQDKQEGETVSLQKINFFYDFPEIIDLRNEIRESIMVMEESPLTQDE